MNIFKVKSIRFFYLGIIVIMMIGFCVGCGGGGLNIASTLATCGTMAVKGGACRGMEGNKRCDDIGGKNNCEDDGSGYCWYCIYRSAGVVIETAQSDSEILVSSTKPVDKPVGWIQLSPSGTLPPARNGYTAIYDGNGNMIIFIGSVNDLWKYNFASNSWIQLSQSGTLPSPRMDPSVIYDGNGNMIIFGGSGGSYFNDLWKYNFASNSWIQLSPSGTLPSPRFYHSAIYDGNGNMFIFGGLSSNGSYFNDLWKYNFASNSWIQLSPSGTLPSPRLHPSAIYDGNGNMIIFGGFSKGSNFNDLWKYNFASNSWIQLSPSGTLPVARTCKNAIYDGNGNMFIFGGHIYSSESYFNDLWKYNFASNSWTLLSPSGYLPAPRANSTAIYNGNMIIFGGFSSNGSYFNDIWKY